MYIYYNWRVHFQSELYSNWAFPGKLRKSAMDWPTTFILLPHADYLHVRLEHTSVSWKSRPTTWSVNLMAIPCLIPKRVISMDLHVTRFGTKPHCFSWIQWSSEIFFPDTCVNYSWIVVTQCLTMDTYHYCTRTQLYSNFWLDVCMLIGEFFQRSNAEASSSLSLDMALFVQCPFSSAILMICHLGLQPQQVHQEYQKLHYQPRKNSNSEQNWPMGM